MISYGFGSSRCSDDIPIPREVGTWGKLGLNQETWKARIWLVIHHGLPWIFLNHPIQGYPIDVYVCKRGFQHLNGDTVFFMGFTKGKGATICGWTAPCSTQMAPNLQQFQSGKGWQTLRNFATSFRLMLVGDFPGLFDRHGRQEEYLSVKKVEMEVSEYFGGTPSSRPF